MRFDCVAELHIDPCQEKFVSHLAASQSGFELAVATDIATRNHKNLMRVVLLAHRGRGEGVRCRQVNASSVCIGNNHSPIIARRKHAESARTDRIWSWIVRRMAVILSARKPGKWASFATHARPEGKFAASLNAQTPGRF
jgi:hypothetical protein